MSSKVFPSTGEKPKFNPNAAYEVVKESPVPKGNKPAFNPTKQFEVVKENQIAQKTPPQPKQEEAASFDNLGHYAVRNGEQVFITADGSIQSIPEEQPAFKPMTDWLNIPQAAQPMVPENAVNEHTAKTSEASERIKGHLSDIDNSVKNLLYNNKKELGGRLKSQQLAVNPAEQRPINFQAQQLEAKERQDTYVSPVEVESFKSEMPNNPVLLRRGLDQKVKDLTKANPAEANALKADIYRLDRQNNPEKESKIAKNIDKINTGELDYDIVNGILQKPIGFFGGLVEGFKEKNKTFEDFEVYDTKNESDIIKHLNKKLTHDSDEPIIVGGEAGMMIGGQPLKPIAGGLLAGAAGGPAAGMAAMTLITGPEMYKLGYASALPQNYAAIKKENPGISDVEAYRQASILADKQASTDAATGMAMGLVGGKLAFKSTGLNAGLLQKSLGSALLQIGEATTKKALEGLGVGAIGAAGQVVKNIMAQQAGLPIDTDMGIKEQLIGGVGMTMGMAMIAKFPEVLKPKTYNQILQAFKGVPKEAIESTLGDLEKAGEITPEQSQAAQKTIQEHQAIDNSIKPNVPEADRLKVQELIKERNELQANLETEDAAYHSDTKEKIKKLNERINGVSKGEERGELQQLVDNEHKAENIKGYTSEVLKNASENDLKKYFKEISEQAHDPNSEAIAVETFGEKIVNKAKELYPKEEPKASSISVIQPGEIKHPETITIKAREEAKEVKPTEKPQYDKAKEGDKVIWDVYGNDAEKEWTVGKKVTMRNGEPGIELIRDISAEESGNISKVTTHIVSIEEFNNNVKSNKDAISVGKPEEIHVGETSSHSQPMGEGIPQSGETTGAQEGGQRPTQEESPAQGQEGKVGEPEMVGITHAEMDKVSRELGLPEYTKDPETFEGWTREAKDRIAKDPDAINKLINKLRNGDMPDPVETQMMKMHFAGLKDKYNNNPTPELLAEINRTKDLYNISGRQAGKELVARKGLIPQEDTLADFHMRDVEFNKGAPLTEEQTVQSTKEFNEIKAAKDALEAKVAKMEADKIKEKAEKKLQQEAKAAKKDTKKDFKTEREKIFTDIKEKLRKARGETSIVAVPYAKELIAIAPDVAKLMKSYVEQGIKELPELVKHIHSALKDDLPEITEKDVHDIIAGEYSEKKPPRSKLATQLFDVRTEARLINELEQLLNGEIPKNEKKQRQRNQKIEALRTQIKGLKDEMGLNERSEAEKLASLKGRYGTKIKDLEEKIAKGDYGPDEKPEPIKLDKDGMALRDEYLRLKDERAIRLLKQQYADRTTGEKLIAGVGKGLRTGRQIQSGFFDVSYPFRQTIVGVARQLLALPFKRENGRLVYEGFKSQRELRKQFGEMYMAFGREKNYRRTMADIKEHPRFDVAKESKLDIAEIDTPLERFKEEEAQTSYAEKIPIAKQGVRMSNRAATVIANKMKFDIFNQLVDGFVQSGKTFENSPELYKEAAKYANQLVGRGFLGEKLEMASPLIGHVLYSLRLQASRLQLLTNFINPRFYAKVPKEIRIEYFKDMAKFVLMGTAMLGLAKAAGLGVELDPRSSDFGSIRWGETRFDIWGGFKQYVTLFSRLLTASTKSPETGQISRLKIPFSAGTPEHREKTYGELLLRFGRTKASPETGTLTDILVGETFDKKAVTARGEAIGFIAPMIIGDVYDAWKDNGVQGAALTYILATHGVGAQSHIKEGDFDDLVSGESESEDSGGSSKKGKPTKPSKPSKTHR